VRTKMGGPYSALRVIDVYKTGDDADLIQLELRKHRPSL